MTFFKTWCVAMITDDRTIVPQIPLFMAYVCLHGPHHTSLPSSTGKLYLLSLDLLIAPEFPNSQAPISSLSLCILLTVPYQTRKAPSTFPSISSLPQPLRFGPMAVPKCAKQGEANLSTICPASSTPLAFFLFPFLFLLFLFFSFFSFPPLLRMLSSFIVPLLRPATLLRLLFFPFPRPPPASSSYRNATLICIFHISVRSDFLSFSHSLSPFL